MQRCSSGAGGIIGGGSGGGAGDTSSLALGGGGGGTGSGSGGLGTGSLRSGGQMGSGGGSGGVGSANYRSHIVRLNSIEPNTVMFSTKDYPILSDVSVPEIIDELEKQFEDKLCDLQGVRLVNVGSIHLSSKQHFQTAFSSGFRQRVHLPEPEGERLPSDDVRLLHARGARQGGGHHQRLGGDLPDRSPALHHRCHHHHAGEHLRDLHWRGGEAVLQGGRHGGEVRAAQAPRPYSGKKSLFNWSHMQNTILNFHHA